MQHPFDGLILPLEDTLAENSAESSTPRRGFFKTAAAYAIGLLTLGMAGSTLARDRWRYRSGNGWTRDYYPQRRYPSYPQRATTYAVGEEGSGGGPVTTYAVGEEGSSGGPVTTYAVGEEGSGGGPVTTKAVGEEGGGGRPTTYAVGEEGSGGGRPPGHVTTYAVGEEGSGGGSGSGGGRMTTQAIGEEGGRSSQRGGPVPRGGV
jgi:hypothetical protein